MKASRQHFYLFIALLSFSSCGTFENLTDDRTRAEDDEMYWNGKELFYDNTLVAIGQGMEDDYYDPNSANRSNSMNGGTNPRASFNPISGWQLSYGLNAFSSYSNGYGMGFGAYSPYNSVGGFNNGYNSYGYNPYGYNSYGYNPYGTYNGFGGYGYNPYGYGMGGLGWGGYGYGNGWGGNGGGWVSNGGAGETANVTHHHRRPLVAGTGNTSTYNRGVLQKSLVQPISETSRTPQPAAPYRANNYNYSNPTYSRPSSTNTQTGPSRPAPSYNSPSHSTPAPSPSSSPSRSTPTHSSPSPSRSTPARTSPPPSPPSRTTSPGKRP